MVDNSIKMFPYTNINIPLLLAPAYLLYQMLHIVLLDRNPSMPFLQDCEYLFLVPYTACVVTVADVLGTGCVATVLDVLGIACVVAGSRLRLTIVWRCSHTLICTYPYFCHPPIYVIRCFTLFLAISSTCEVVLDVLDTAGEVTVPDGLGNGCVVTVPDVVGTGRLATVLDVLGITCVVAGSS